MPDRVNRSESKRNSRPPIQVELLESVHKKSNTCRVILYSLSQITPVAAVRVIAGGSLIDSVGIYMTSREPSTRKLRSDKLRLPTTRRVCPFLYFSRLPPQPLTPPPRIPSADLTTFKQRG